ncbi:methyltransferase domain-containing protein [Candidatus Bathyarchaeota archaeon]|nr:methyltransferase domain-containing protein [Candidatus Bathyarchaeota archaeon]
MRIYKGIQNPLTTLKRKETAEKIHVKGKTLDKATGPSYFAIQVTKTHPETTITGIDIFEASIKTARKNIKKEGLQDQIKIIQMDATDLQFMDESLDIATNYLGLEDIHMTRERKGVVQAFREAHRVLEPGGSFYFVVIPVGRLDTWAQRVEAEAFNRICGAKWLHHKEYLQIL